MKKAIKIGAFAMVATMALASCKKDWTCSCDNGDYTYAIKDKKKKDAEAQCEGKASVGLISIDIDNGCKLK